jgi:hypothetical protein
MGFVLYETVQGKFDISLILIQNVEVLLGLLFTFWLSKMVILIGEFRKQTLERAAYYQNQAYF